MQILVYYILEFEIVFNFISDRQTVQQTRILASAACFHAATSIYTTGTAGIPTNHKCHE